jgi:hypothetical protein
MTTKIEQFRQILPISSLLLILGGTIPFLPPLPRFRGGKPVVSSSQQGSGTAIPVPDG